VTVIHVIETIRVLAYTDSNQYWQFNNKSNRQFISVTRPRSNSDYNTTMAICDCKCRTGRDAWTWQ